MILIPSIEEQERAVSALDPAKLASEQLYARALKSLKLAEEVRYAYLFKQFGFPGQLYRGNPEVKLRDIIELRGSNPDAHFWIQRSGQEYNVGRPFRRSDPSYLEMEDDVDWQDRPKYLAGSRKIFEARVPRKGLDPRNHIGVTVLRTDLLLPEYLYYVAEYAWKAKIYQQLCHGTLRLQHIRQEDVFCALNTVFKGPRRRNPDSRLRQLERELSMTGDKNIAISLYYERKRAGDPAAGYKYYDWLCDQYLRHDDNLVDPSEPVWVIDGYIYCNECGDDEAHEVAYYAEPSLRDYDPWNLDIDHSAVENLLYSRYAHKDLPAFLRKAPTLTSPARNINRNKQIDCSNDECDLILKLNNEPATWIEVFHENSPPSEDDFLFGNI